MLDNSRSKYARKVQERRRLARKLGLRKDATWPEIWDAQREAEIYQAWEEREQEQEVDNG